METRVNGNDEVKKALSNKVISFAMAMRDVLNKIKQTSSSEQALGLTDNALKLLENFEEDATGERLLPTPETP